MGVFDWKEGAEGGDNKSKTGVLAPLWWIFFPMAGGLTLVVLFIFWQYLTGWQLLHWAAEKMNSLRGKGKESGDEEKPLVF